MRLLYEDLVKRLMESGLTRKEAEHLFVLALEDVVIAMDDRMLEDNDNFLMFISGFTRKSPLS